MQQTLIAIITFFMSSLYVILLNYLAGSSRVIQKAIVIPLITLLIIFYLTRKTPWNKILNQQNKWFLLFLCATFIQLLVISTGGLKSPFLILIHLCMIGLSFAINFSISILFLISSCIILLVDINSHYDLITLFTQAPTTIILQCISLISIVPIAYIISQHYHIKDTQAAVDEAILSQVEELIFITDYKLQILSINDAVTRNLQKSRGELLLKPLFEILLLRDKEGKLVNKETFFSEENPAKPTKNLSNEFMLINARSIKRKIKLNIQPIKNLDGNYNQISFIINPSNQPPAQENTFNFSLEKTRTKYEALFANIKNQLENRKDTEKINKQMILLEKIETDIFTIQNLHQNQLTQNKASIDIAKLCEQITLYEKKFAGAFNVSTQFNLENFGKKDIAPLTVKNYPVKPEELTGPFFTIKTDSKNVELIIDKLVTLCIFIATLEKNANVLLSTKLKTKNEIIVTISTIAPIILEKNLKEIFKPYYGKLSSEANLNLGSGLEGYIAKTLTENLGLTLEVKYSQANIIFTLNLK